MRNRRVEVLRIPPQTSDLNSCLLEVPTQKCNEVKRARKKKKSKLIPRRQPKNTCESRFTNIALSCSYPTPRVQQEQRLGSQGTVGRHIGYPPRPESTSCTLYRQPPRLTIANGEQCCCLGVSPALNAERCVCISAPLSFTDSMT